MTVLDAPMVSDFEGSSSNIHFCNLCNKPIASESAFKRHVAYCRRTVGKPKKRKRSCKQCHRAKAKCSFEPQCSRCIFKGFTCEYEKPVTPLASSEASIDFQDSSTPDTSGSSPSDGVSSPGQTNADTLDNITAMIELQLASPPRPAIELRTDVRHQASIMFLLENLRGLPHSLSRRETFPPFVHGQWHVPELPETLANCVRISQLWLVKNNSPRDTERFHLALSEEKRRLMHQLSTATRQELAASIVVQNAYLVFAALENDLPQAGDALCGTEMYREDIEWITSTARQCFAYDHYGPFNIDNLGDPNETWEEFIYAESRRRCALLFFIASRVIDLRCGAHCPPIVGHRGLSLPAPEALWNARTERDWEAARAEIRERYRDPLHHTTLRTIGDLIDSRACASDPDRSRDVSNWLAACDKLGLIVMVASTMV
ncbi:hypothetical protein F4802DRAFT_580785 [Xylaria palmicola]|nr:hypothetical protein F4802DRAFT_580785 [Xylaria palmicola]